MSISEGRDLSMSTYCLFIFKAGKAQARSGPLDKAYFFCLRLPLPSTPCHSDPSYPQRNHLRFLQEYEVLVQL